MGDLRGQSREVVFMSYALQLDVFFRHVQFSSQCLQAMWVEAMIACILCAAACVCCAACVTTHAGVQGV